MKNPLRITLYCLLLLCCCHASRAQSLVYSPTRADSISVAGRFAEYEQHYKDELNTLPSRNRKDYQELYAKRWENIKEVFDQHEIYTSPEAQQYLDRLVTEIVRANPILKDHPFSCYFSRSSIPNASYIGEGIILFNMGLFDRLHNESEAVFVLCHEISHFLLRHTENRIDEYVTTINSEAVQTELRRIKGSEYRRNEQLEKLVKGLTFDSRRHSRDHESQADSMGVELMRHTRWALSGASSTLALLDVVDIDTLNTASCLRQQFNAAGYPFRERWIAREEGLLGGHAHLKQDGMVDSLKTHPDCQTRIKLLAPLVGGSAGSASVGGSAGATLARGPGGAGLVGGSAGAASAKFVVDSLTFLKLQRKFRYEVIEYAYASEHYASSLFLTLEMLQQAPGDSYLVAQTGRILNGMYAAQKAHRLSKVVELPAPDYPSNYNLLLQFIQNLHLEEMASISYHYLSRWHPQLDHNAAFGQAYAESAKDVQQQ